MSFSSSPPSPDATAGLKKFVTEKELAEEKDSAVKRRPEPPAVDNRTLYERLQENKLKAEEEFKERTKYQAPAALEPEDVEFFLDKERAQLIKLIEREEEVQRELQKVRRTSHKSQ